MALRLTSHSSSFGPFDCSMALASEEIINALTNAFLNGDLKLRLTKLSIPEGIKSKDWPIYFSKIPKQ